LRSQRLGLINRMSYPDPTLTNNKVKAKSKQDDSQLHDECALLDNLLDAIVDEFVNVNSDRDSSFMTHPIVEYTMVDNTV
jgi:hypothetical protein